MTRTMLLAAAAACSLAGPVLAGDAARDAEPRSASSDRSRSTFSADAGEGRSRSGADSANCVCAEPASTRERGRATEGDRTWRDDPQHEQFLHDVWTSG